MLIDDGDPDRSNSFNLLKEQFYFGACAVQRGNEVQQTIAVINFASFAAEKETEMEWVEEAGEELADLVDEEIEEYFNLYEKGNYGYTTSNEFPYLKAKAYFEKTDGTRFEFEKSVNLADYLLNDFDYYNPL